MIHLFQFLVLDPFYKNLINAKFSTREIGNICQNLFSNTIPAKFNTFMVFNIFRYRALHYAKYCSKQ